MQMSLEFRGRHSITKKYPKLKNDIEQIIEKYKKVDSHFKTETLFISLDPQKIITELVLNYNYMNLLSHLYMFFLDSFHLITL